MRLGRVVERGEEVACMLAALGVGDGVGVNAADGQMHGRRVRSQRVDGHG